MAQGRFKATGTISLNAMDSNNPWIRSGKTKAGDDYHTFGCAVVAAKNNRMYCELFGMKSKVIKTIDTDGNKIEISWEDRFDADIVKSVANYRKITINLGDDRKEFISAYDAVQYLSEHEAELKEGLFVVSGQVTKNIYNGRISDRFQIQGIYAAADDVKPSLKITTDFVWCKDSVDVADFATDKKITIDGWVQTYISKEEGNKYVPQQIVLDCSKIDFENEKHVAIMKFKLDGIGVEYADGKVKVNLKKNTYYKVPIEVSYVNGAEQIEFTEAELTDYQKQQIELGLKKLDDFRPSGSMYGQRVIIYKLTSFDTRGEYADGKIELQDDISDEIYVISTEEKAEDVLSGESTATESDDDGEDLFD